MKHSQTKRRDPFWMTWRRPSHNLGTACDSDDLARMYHGYVPNGFGIYMAKWRERRRPSPSETAE